MSIWRKLIERAQNTLAITHQVQHFDISIATFEPNFIRFNFIKIRKPLLKSDSSVFIGIVVVFAILNLLLDDLILHIVMKKSRLSWRCLGGYCKRVARADAIFEIGYVMDSVFH